MAQPLGLDQALISVNKTGLPGTLDVYYQLDECFGCPLNLIKRLNSSAKYDQLVLPTKYLFQLELRNASTNSTLCHLQHLDLNDHAHYKLDLSNYQQQPDCNLVELDQGQCSLCPLALLSSLILLICLAERLNPKFRRFFTARNKQASSLTSQGADSCGLSQSSSSDQMQTGDIEQQVTTEGEEMNAVASKAAINEIHGKLVKDEDSSAEVRKTRLQCLDAFRGLSIVGMILVNYGGAGYQELQHRYWDGVSAADFVFPLFIFAMGASIACSIESAYARGLRLANGLLIKIMRRSLLLFLLGLCLNSYWLNSDSDGLDQLRITGVLQRFSISYLVVATLYAAELSLLARLNQRGPLNLPWIRGNSLPALVSILGLLCELSLASICLGVYVFVTFYLSYDSTGACPAGYIGPGGQTQGGQFFNCTGGAAGWLDRKLLGHSHMYRDTELRQLFKSSLAHDPEGILGNTTSILLTLAGLQCGKLLVSRLTNDGHRIRLALMSLGALVCLSFTGLSLYIAEIPLNKRLWSISYVSLMSSTGYSLMGFLYLILDVLGKRCSLVHLLMSAGQNSILLYVAHSMLGRMLPWHFAVDQSSHLQLLARLTWATLLWLLLAQWLARKRFYLKL